MKKCIIIIVLIGSSFGLQAQLSLVVEELRVSNIQPKIGDNVFEEDETEGPYVSFKCRLTNVAETKLYLHPSISDISIFFNYKGVDYKSEAEAMPFTDKNIIVLDKKVSETFTIGSNLLLGTPMWSEDETDYRMILLEILPTVRVKYKEDNLECYSVRIKKVIILE